MDDLVGRTTEAVTRVQAVVDRVCGSCDNSCCHQGTMMGSHDALRLLRGMQLEAGREERVREGLRERAVELRADLDTLRSVHGLLVASADHDPAALEKLDPLLDDWERFCEFLEGLWEAGAESLQRMLRFAGTRALTLRAVTVFPGAQAALTTLARPGASFRFRRRRLAPPRCLFHSLQTGCLAGRWKPGKCANFFCSGEPNVLQELRAELSFDDFVLGNAELVSLQDALRMVSLEWRLGREYVEPKILLGMDDAGVEQLRGLPELEGRRFLAPPLPAGRFMQSCAECERFLEGLEPDDICILQVGSVDGAALYELAIALDRRRAAGDALAFMLAAGEFSTPSALPHPLWDDSQMSQPLGVLDLLVIDPGAEGPVLTTPPEEA